MREVTVATVQMKPKLGETEENLVKMSELVAKIAGQQKVDLIVFPELITSGYECGVRFTDLAQRVPGPTVNLIAQRAQEFGVHIAFGLPTKEKVESILFNSLVFIGPDGELIGALCPHCGFPVSKAHVTHVASVVQPIEVIARPKLREAGLDESRALEIGMAS